MRKQNSADGMNQIQPDLKEAQRFLDLLAPEAKFSFQTFSDRKKNDDRRVATSGYKPPNLNRILHGKLSQHANTLVQLNAQGAGVFIMVNQGDQQGRKKENVTTILALFVDLDGSPLEPVLASGVAPHITVESSPGRFHAYWRVADCPLEQFTPLQAALAAKFNSDPKVKDLPRVMRLPGFLHQKGQAFQTRILSGNLAQPYALADLVKRLGIDAVPARVAKPATAKAALPADGAEIMEGSRNGTLASLAGSMRRRGMSEDAILAALLAENAARCNPPLDDSEVQGIAHSVAQYASDETASLPTYSRSDLVAMIEATTDFDELTGRIAKLVAISQLREAERDALHKAISKKTGVTRQPQAGRKNLSARHRRP